MNEDRTPIDVAPLPQGTTRIPLVEPVPGWNPKPSTFDEVYVLPDGETLEVRALHGNWNHVARLEVDESADDLVRLTLLLADNEPPRGGTWHTAEGYRVRTRTRLSRPLGDRRVVDMARPTPDQVRRATIERAARQRADVGLADDEPTVVALLDALAAGDPDVVGDETGIALTRAEAAQVAEIRREVEETATFIRGWIANGHSAVDAGSIRTWGADGGGYVAQIADEQLADELRAALRSGGFARWSVRAVRYSEAELRPLIRQSMDLLREAGFDVRGAGLDTRGNRVRVHIWDETDLEGAIRRAEQLLGERFPGDSFTVGA